MTKTEAVAILALIMLGAIAFADMTVGRACPSVPDPETGIVILERRP